LTQGQAGAPAPGPRPQHSLSQSGGYRGNPVPVTGRADPRLPTRLQGPASPCSAPSRSGRSESPRPAPQAPRRPVPTPSAPCCPSPHPGSACFGGSSCSPAARSPSARPASAAVRPFRAPGVRTTRRGVGGARGLPPLPGAVHAGGTWPLPVSCLGRRWPERRPGRARSSSPLLLPSPLPPRPPWIGARVARASAPSLPRRDRPARTRCPGNGARGWLRALGVRGAGAAGVGDAECGWPGRERREAGPPVTGCLGPSAGCGGRAVRERGAEAPPVLGRGMPRWPPGCGSRGRAVGAGVPGAGPGRVGSRHSGCAAPALPLSLGHGFP
jgi:hypothetical protein